MRTIIINPELIDNITAEEAEILCRITTKGWKLRASKPPLTAAQGTDTAILDGYAQFVWRHIVFQVSEVSAHRCMPVMADFYLCSGYTRDAYPKFGSPERKEIQKRLDAIVERFVNTLPPTEWAGIARWGRALGYL